MLEENNSKIYGQQVTGDILLTAMPALDATRNGRPCPSDLPKDTEKARKSIMMMQIKWQMNK